MFENAYFINGTAYAGKSTIVKALAAKHNGYACEENYHNILLEKLDKAEFPCLTYTRDLTDWRHFIRRTPDEYEAWVNGVTLECERLELELLPKLCAQNKYVFVDTNITLPTLRTIAPKNHVLIMLADPQISVTRFFDRPDKEKQFLYRLLTEEADSRAALANFRQCLERINSPAKYNEFLSSGFPVITRDPARPIPQTLALAEKLLGLG